jgi:hypothetical protein
MSKGNNLLYTDGHGLTRISYEALSVRPRVIRGIHVQNHGRSINMVMMAVGDACAIQFNQKGL